MSKKLVSMGDLRKEGDKPEDKKRNTLYTGGANSGSGQNVIGPRTLSHDDDEDDDEGEGGGDGRAAVDRVFRQQGVGGTWRRQAMGGSGGMRLGGAPSGVGVASATAPHHRAPALPLPHRPLHPSCCAGSGEGAAVRIVFYRNGFVVDDGELRGLDDPANRAFVNDINRGCVAVVAA